MKWDFIGQWTQREFLWTWRDGSHINGQKYISCYLDPLHGPFGDGRCIPLQRCTWHGVEHDEWWNILVCGEDKYRELFVSNKEDSWHNYLYLYNMFISKVLLYLNFCLYSITRAILLMSSFQNPCQVLIRYLRSNIKNVAKFFCLDDSIITCTLCKPLKH
jgi:hypothetical protein